MRRAILVGLILAAAPGWAGTQRVTVWELEQILAPSASTSSPDPDSIGNTDLLDQINREDALAPRIAALELTERLTLPVRARLVAKYKLGPLTRAALELLADQSALLDPPASEMPAQPPPDEAAQGTMVRRAGEFVFKTLHHLPDFFAQLNTTQFDDGPLVVAGEKLTSGPGLHFVGSSQTEITFRDGQEVFGALRSGPAADKPEEGLGSQGEFGSQAAVVMLDLAHGTVSFHHWERSLAGTVAVFRYAVPQASSHYTVRYACRGKPGFHAQPAYHGTLSIDPAKGVLMRYTVEAESSSGDPIRKVASAVDYGVVALGDRRYLCPVRSLAFTVEETDACHESHKRVLPRPVSMLNRSVFSGYHRLGSEMVIVPGEQKPASPDEGRAGAGRKAPESPEKPAQPPPGSTEEPQKPAETPQTAPANPAVPPHA